MSLDCGRNLELLEETHADMRRTCKLHTEGLHHPGFKPVNLLLATAPLCWYYTGFYSGLFRF